MKGQKKVRYTKNRRCNMKKKWWAASLAVAMVITSVPAIPAAVYAAEPMLIEAEDYSSYSGKLKVMTNNKNASGGKYVGDFDNLDCLSYKIQIEKAGNYQITLTVGTIQDGGIALLNCGGNVSEKISIPNTKNWNTYRDVTATLWLDEGEQVLTVSNMGATWNIDKLTLTYVDSEKTADEQQSYQKVHMENRWKSQRITEQNGSIAYADTGTEAYDTEASLWNLIPNEDGWYTIQNVSTGNYMILKGENQETGPSENGNVQEEGQWKIGNINGYLVFYNRKYPKCGLNVEYQSQYPGKVTATGDTLIKWYSAQWKLNTPAKEHTYEILGDRIEGTAGLAVSKDGKSITVSQQGEKKEWTLSQDVSGEPIFEAKNMPIMEAVYNLSIEESLLNINDGLYGKVFWTGTNWHKVWTRDTAMSVQYSLAWIFPEETKNSILEKIVGGTENPRVWEEDTGTGGSYPNSVDRIIMEIAGFELYKTTGDKEFLEKIYEISKNTLEQDYHVAYDEQSGLFKGETGGLDHRSKTYPDWMDEREQNSIYNITESKAANANIIFAQALQIMEESAEILGKDESEVKEWNRRYESLKKAINEHFWLEERKMYASWEYPQYMGSPVADKVDVIANGYALLSDVASESQKQQIMENYPLVIYGADTVWPQKNGRQASAIYHNRGVWPGWETAMMIGAKENGNLQLADEIFKSCVRGAGMSLTNKEVINFETGEGVHSDRQLWSIAGTLAGYYRVLFGMNYDTDGILFTPYVPEWMNGPFVLKNYKYRNAVLNLTVSGKGDTLESITVNGEEKPLDYVLPADASGTYEIVMKVSDSGKRSKIHLEEDSFAVCPDMPVLTEESDGRLTWDENPDYTYKLWTGSEYVPVSSGSYQPDRSKYGTYSLVATDQNGVTSEMSKPIMVSPENSKLVYEAEDGTYNAENFENTAQGYSGRGYVVDFLDRKTDLAIEVDVLQSGNYQLSMIYNNYGDATTGQDCAMRSVYVDGKEIGTLIFPIVNFDFQQSPHLYVNLEKGKHTVEIRYNVSDWYDTNMATIRGTKKNSVSYDSLTLQYLGERKGKGETAAKGLDQIITMLENLDDSQYTDESWKDLETAVKEAKAVWANEHSSQKELDQALDALLKTFGNLEYAVQKVHLEVAVQTAEQLLAEAVNYEDMDALQMAVEEGKALLSNTAATQEEADQAAERILTLLAKSSKKADVKSLESLIEQANKFTNEKFTSGSFKNLQDQIEKAEAVLSNTEREEDEIAKAYEELLQAIIGLERKANKAALQAVIARAEAVLASSDCYTASTLDGLEELLADAKEVYQKEDAVQQEVNEAVKSLTLKVAEARLKGDVDGNGKIGTSDSVLLLQYAAEMTVLDEISAESADVNGDKAADTQDAVWILQYASEKTEQ